MALGWVLGAEGGESARFGLGERGVRQQLRAGDPHWVPCTPYSVLKGGGVCGPGELANGPEFHSCPLLPADPGSGRTRPGRKADWV